MPAVAKRSLLRDLSLPAVVAGFITVLVGFASSAVIVFRAAQAVGATQAQIASWMWALGLGMGLTCIGLSLRYRVPVVTAWSTPVRRCWWWAPARWPTAMPSGLSYWLPCWACWPGSPVCSPR